MRIVHKCNKRVKLNLAFFPCAPPLTETRPPRSLGFRQFVMSATVKFQVIEIVYALRVPGYRVMAGVTGIFLAAVYEAPSNEVLATPFGSRPKLILALRPVLALQHFRSIGPHEAPFVLVTALGFKLWRLVADAHGSHTIASAIPLIASTAP